SRLTKRDSMMRRIVSRAAYAPSVIIGGRALVGYSEKGDARAAESFGLKPGVFGVTESWPRDGLTGEELSRAYSFYARNQSASLDCGILFRSLKNKR
ncbi:MAG TPA: hypothetical protein VF190_13280, partial [Rhodothermales bacterium]